MTQYLPPVTDHSDIDPEYQTDQCYQQLTSGQGNLVNAVPGRTKFTGLTPTIQTELKNIHHTNT